MDLLPVELLWGGAVAAIPLALVVAAVCRWAPCRPATRHSLWLVVLVVLVVAPLLPRPTLPQGPAAVVTVGDRPPLAAVPTRTSVGLAVAPPSAPLGVLPDARVLSRETPGWRVRTVFGSPGTSPAPRPATQPKRLAPDRPGTGDDRLPPARALPAARQVDAAPAATPAVVDAPPAAAPTPVAAAPAQPPPAAALPAALKAAYARFVEAAGRYLERLGAVRDAVLSVGPIPLPLWVAGIGVLLLVTAVRISRSGRLVRRAEAAPGPVVVMVAAAAERLGLTRAPATLMVDEPISPMLWCGRRVYLILPRPLWGRLDEIGRNAVVYHELAHLRRRDHWVCWAELLIGWIYWWHPVVWWIRRRLREEAEVCCDAWVTTLLPGGRRAYAQALLEARKTSNVTFPAAVPSVGLGARTLRAKRFARRLTMVMTAQMSPRLSVRGIALASAVAVCGYLVSPLLACPTPPKDPCTPARAAKIPKPPRAPKLVVPAASPGPVFAPRAEATTFEQYMRQRPDRDDMSLEERIEELERQLDRLHEHLQRLRGIGLGRGIAAPEIVAVEIPQVEFVAPLAMMQPGGFGILASGDAGCLERAARSGGEMVVRTYELSEGKLKAISELMVRSDVPIAVRPFENRIEVHATEAQQCVFEAFCMMIDGDDEVKGYKLSEGKLKALTDLMVRSDVPILVEPGSEAIKVHGTDLEQAVFGAFVAMIHPDGARTRVGRAADAYATALGNLAHSYESQAATHVYQRRAMESALRAIEGQVRNFERQADRLGERSQRLAEKAEKLVEEAEELREEAEDQGGRARSRALAKAESRMKKAETLRKQAEQLRVQAEGLQEQVEALEDGAEEMEDRIEELDEKEDEEEAR